MRFLPTPRSHVIVLSTCTGLFCVNSIICLPLFRTEYLDAFQSNEGSFMVFAKFLLDHWPNVGWFPWLNAGMPFENTYLPLLPSLIAVVSVIMRWSVAHAFHFVAACTYALAPVLWFLF